MAPADDLADHEGIDEAGHTHDMAALVATVAEFDASGSP